MIKEWYILEGGTIFYPLSGIFEKKNLIWSDGEIRQEIPQGLHENTMISIDCTGCIITSGLIDLHSHLYYTAEMPGGWAGEYGLKADMIAPSWGVTTMVDAGSTGWRNWDHFETTVINPSKTRILAFLNVCGYGMLHEALEQESSEFNINKALSCSEEHRDCIIGVKTAHYRGSDWMAIDKSLEFAGKAHLPVMVDFGYFKKERPLWILLKEKLRKGDILTHCFRGTVPWFNGTGEIFPYLNSARNKGILFDTGHGGGSFLFRNAVPATRAGFYPDTISTDAHMISLLGSMQSLTACMNRFYTMGMPIDEIFKSVTSRAASIIGRPDLVELKTGSCADISVWSMRKGQFGYGDSVGDYIEGNEALECEMTIRGGEILWDRNGRSYSKEMRENSKSGIRAGDEWLLEPPDDF